MVPTSSSTGCGDAADIEKERAGIESEFGVKALYDKADMSKPAEIAAMIANAEKAFGSVDVLVNNAGIQFVSPVEEFPIDKWDAIIAINMSSAFHAIRAAVPGMKARKWGRIIQHRVGAFARRVAVQVGLCHGQTRHRGPHEDGGTRTRDVWCHL